MLFKLLAVSKHKRNLVRSFGVWFCRQSLSLMVCLDHFSAPSALSFFHLSSSPGSRLQTSVLVATVANKYRGPVAFIQTKILRRTSQKQMATLNDDNSHDKTLKFTVLYSA